MNGLDIRLEEFRKMKALDRDILVYNNLTHIRRKLGDYQVHRKIQYIWLFVLTVAFGLKKYLGF